MASSDAQDTSTADSELARTRPDDKIQLGKLLFEDKALSEPRGQACAACHDHAFC